MRQEHQQLAMARGVGNGERGPERGGEITIMRAASPSPFFLSCHLPSARSLFRVPRTCNPTDFRVTRTWARLSSSRVFIMELARARMSRAWARLLLAVCISKQSFQYRVQILRSVNRFMHFAGSTLDSVLWPSTQRPDRLLMLGCGSTLSKTKMPRTSNARLTEQAL